MSKIFKELKKSLLFINYIESYSLVIILLNSITVGYVEIDV